MMSLRSFALAALLLPVVPVGAQSSEESLQIYSEHPRIFAKPQHLRLLRRERERQSGRWQQLELFVTGKAPLPERGFALALYHITSGDKSSGRQAVEWALSSAATDLRQLAIVYDWCFPVLAPAEEKSLAAKIKRGVQAAERDESVSGVRSRAMAAVAVADAQVLDRIVNGWWRGRIVPAVKAGKPTISLDDAFPLFELLHVIRDNTAIDLREAIPQFFKDYPIEHLASHYPAIYPAPDGEYRIPAMVKGGEPEVRRAALARAAELAMVAFDANSSETQVLQGWLMNDRFLLRGTFGTPYEFLWANPYQPGLSYYQVPLVYHNTRTGTLFARSSWDEDATWFGAFSGTAQLFANGRLTALNPELNNGPYSIKDALIFTGKNITKLTVVLQQESVVFVVGLKPRQRYEIEVDDQELREEQTDPGGILRLDVPQSRKVGVRLKESAVQ